LSININHSTNSITTEGELSLDAENDISVSDNRIKNVADPVDLHDAVTKSYLETTIQSNNFLYSNNTPMPEEVGGYEPGDTFTNVTLQQLFTNLLYPYQYPEVAEFYIDNQETIIEVGDSVAGGIHTFMWDVTNDANVAANSITIEDTTNSVVYGSTYNNNNNSESIDIGSSVVKTTAKTNTWKISASNTKGQVISKNFTVHWKWRVYYGSNANSSLSDSDIKSRASTSLVSNFTGNKEVDAGGYKYFIYPTSFGLKNNFKDVSSGFAVAMEPSYTTSIVNDFGISTEYYVHRTSNPIVSALTIAVS
jgi:hypothetical protein